MSNLETIQDLLDHIRSARLPEAIEKFYADDVVMQDNSNPPVIGKQANRDREQAFAEAIARASLDVKSITLAGDRVALEYVLDVLLKDGSHLILDQVSIQHWKDGKIIHERFYYDSATVAQKEAAA